MKTRSSRKAAGARLRSSDIEALRIRARESAVIVAQTQNRGDVEPAHRLLVLVMELHGLVTRALPNNVDAQRGLVDAAIAIGTLLRDGCRDEGCETTGRRQRSLQRPS